MLKAYFKPELYPLGRATFLTHGYELGSGDPEKDSNGQESLFDREYPPGNDSNNGNNNNS